MIDSTSSAISRLEEHVGSHPDDAEALHDLSILYQRTGRQEDAFAAAQKVVALAPNLAEGWLNLGNLHAVRGDLDSALSSFRKTTGLAPVDALAWYNIGNILAQTGRQGESIDAFEQACELAPNNVSVLASLALAYRKLNRISDAVTTYKRALNLDPGNKRIHSNLLVALQYDQNATDQTLYHAHRQWDDTPAVSRILQASGEKQPLTVGYVSGDFRQHPVGFFLRDVLRHHDRNAILPVCLSDTVLEDSFTDDIRKHAHQWVDTRGLDDGAFIDAVHQHGIDILVDLSGHLNHSRLTAFAKRAAPVQATWAGYVGTTGLAAMDWLIADRHHAPDGYDTYTSERIVRLPQSYVCYAPVTQAPPVSPLPWDSSDHITFGSLNNPAKINDSVLAAWAECLSAIPASRLILKYRGFEQPTLSAEVIDTFVKAGIHQDRIDIRTGSPHQDLLNTYGEIDIALDPFPYSGGLTTLEALWMGVPVITKRGETFAGRHSAAYLSGVGLADWIADNIDDYVALAKAKAADKESLRTVRQSLRAALSASPICDAKSFTRGLEQAFQTMWRVACKETPQDAVPRVLDVPLVS